MFKWNKSQSVQRAKDYFKKSLRQADYYASDDAVGSKGKDRQEDMGIWHGRGAELLGLSGDIKRRDFEALLDGHGITTKKTANRRAGWDLTFSAPKSVSLVWARGGEVYTKLQ